MLTETMTVTTMNRIQMTGVFKNQNKTTTKQKEKKRCNNPFFFLYIPISRYMGGFSLSYRFLSYLIECNY